MSTGDASDEQACLSAWLFTNGVTLSMAFKAAIELGILEVMAKASEGEGSTLLTPEEIAAQLKAKNPDAPAMLERLLRLLASQSILTCSTTINTDADQNTNQRRYGLGDISRFFLIDEDGGSFLPFFLLARQKVYMESWSHLKDAVLEGGNPFHRANGMNLFDYNLKDPCVNELFNKSMRSHSTIIMKRILQTSNGFHRLHSLVDVGGGTGDTLSLVTAKYPHIKGTNFDLPHVIQEAPQFPGVDRVGGDMFTGVPTGDAILLKWILHDWDDDHCLKLLKNCWNALPENGKVIVVEMVLPEIVDNSLSTLAVLHLDMVMMVQCPGGKERTKKELEGLAKAAGFTGIEAICCAYNFWVVEFYKNKETNLLCL
ncbi:unnamed protein product [Victoria cruziana]